MITNNDMIGGYIIIGVVVLVFIFLAITSWLDARHRVDTGSVSFRSPMPPPSPKDRWQQGDNNGRFDSNRKRFIAIYDEDNNRIQFISEDRIEDIYVDNGTIEAIITAYGTEYRAGEHHQVFYVSAALVSRCFEEYIHNGDDLKKWLACEVGLGYFANMAKYNVFSEMYEQAMRTKDNEPSA